MNALYLISVVLHILAAALWVGGMGFFALVVVPVVRRNLGEAQARNVLREAGARFATIGWVVLGLLVATGIANLAFRGVLPLLVTASFWLTSFGSTLATKLTLFALVLVTSLAHSLDARRSIGSQPSRAPFRAAMLGRATLLLSIAVVVLAVFLVRGTPW
jgi:putative copper export protein